jgi:biopolymer transport protein ExbD
MWAKPFALRARARIEMVPLIDMFFLLLVFFIFGVFSMTMQQGILVDLPAAATATAQREEAVTISLTAEGAVFVDQQPATMEALPGLLQDVRARRADALVLLNADQATRHGLVVAALDAVRAAGLQRVSLQAEPHQ